MFFAMSSSSFNKYASKPVSRVLYLTVIYLGRRLPYGSSHPGERPGQPCAPAAVLLRIEFTGPAGLPAAGELLPRLSTLTARMRGGISLLHYS